jgi:hypothetical protein
MDSENIDLILENESLKNEFAIRNLDLDQVFQSTPDDIELENRHLNNLLDWVNKYTICPFRKKMEADGYLYPPIDPHFSPDNDWFLFERWMKGLPVRLRVFDQLSVQYIQKNPDELSDKELACELAYLNKILYEIRISVDLKEGLPARLVYTNLMDMLNEEFDLLIEGFWHLDGCTGYCPDCFQRPWCEAGSQSCWPEDEKIGEMYLHDSVRKYVSPSPVSLIVLKKYQAAEDKRIEEFEKSYKAGETKQQNPALFDNDEDDNLPF